MSDRAAASSQHLALRQERNLALIFAVLGVLVTVLIALHWFLVLEPNLRESAQSHSRVLAQAQSIAIEHRIETAPPELMREELETAMDGVLLLQDRATGQPFMRRITLMMDYEQLEVPSGSLDLSRGDDHCPECFVARIPLYRQQDRQLVGQATFYASPKFLESTVERIQFNLLWVGAFILCVVAVAWVGAGRLLRRLADRDAQIRGLIDHAPAVVYIKDLEGRYRLVNRRCETLFGIAGTDMVGKTPDQLLPRETAEIFVGDDQALIASLTSQTKATTIETAEGPRALLLSQFAIFDSAGSATGICGIAVDITERLRIERELEVALAKYRTLFDAFPLGIIVSDGAGRIVEANTASEQLLEVSEEEQRKRRVDAPQWRILCPDGTTMAPSENPALEALAERRVIRDRELGLVLESGEVRWLGVSAAPLPIEGLGAVVVFKDISARKQIQAAREAEVALRESERRFRIMANELPLIIWAYDATSPSGLINKTCRDFFGLPEDTLTPLGWRPLVHPDDQARYLAGFSASHAARTPFKAQCRMRRADGQWRWMESFARPFYDPNGDYAGIVGTSIDITERRAADQALQESHQELELRAEQLGRLASALSLAEQRERERLAKVLHDHIQQLLVAAAFGIERLERRLGSQLHDAVAQDSVDSVKELLQQAIDSARTLVADLSPPILHDGGLADALEWLARSMRSHYDLRVRLSLDRDVSPRRADVKSVVFESVREALFNVFKHAKCTQVQLELGRTENGQLRILVQDQGAGFEMDRLTQTQTEDAGTGFGLLSMRERLRFLGGSCTIESRPGEGTRVVLIAPLDAQSDSTHLSSGASPPSPVAPIADAPRVQPMDAPIRILLVDDHAVMRYGLFAMLEDETDLEVVAEASNGYEAIELVERYNPNLVLMDYSMPEMDGLEATRRIKARWPGVRIIGLSMYEEADRAQAMLEAGASGYLAKTAGADALLDIIRGGGPPIA